MQAPSPNPCLQTSPAFRPYGRAPRQQPAAAALPAEARDTGLQQPLKEAQTPVLPQSRSDTAFRAGICCLYFGKFLLRGILLHV